MGSPLGPTFYIHYVDDIFCVFRNESSYKHFLDVLNSLHRSLRFTFELGPSVLAFLDTLISLPDITGEQFLAQVYRKPTYWFTVKLSGNVPPQMESWFNPVFTSPCLLCMQ